MCRACQAVDLHPTSQNGGCPVCMSSSDFEVVQLAQPHGFRTLFNAHWDFDGVFEWTPRASYPKTSPEIAEMVQLPNTNCQFWSDEAEVCIVNDNAGRKFEFRKLAGSQTWVTQDAIDHVADQMTQHNLQQPNPTYDQTTPPEVRVLGSIKRTDLLVVGLRSIRPELDLSPLQVTGRAALYSFGFLLRRAMSVLLDISTLEIRVGLRVYRHAGQATGEVFLSDSLENGAGYCSHFERPDELERLLRFVADPNNSLMREFFAAYHAGACQTSCPDCLRDYANLAWHCILDWRLAVDMARLALNPEAPIDLNLPHWQPLAVAATQTYFQAFQILGGTPTTFGGLPGVRHGTSGEFITHPLWASHHPAVVSAEQDARVAGVTRVRPKTLFEVVRRPF